MNMEVQRLLQANEHLQQENKVFKVYHEKQMEQNPQSQPPQSQQWSSNELKEAKMQIQDLRHQNQNLLIEIRGAKDRVTQERKDFLQLKDKLAEQIQKNRQLTLDMEQIKADFKSTIQQKQSCEQFSQQSHQHVQVLKKELDHSERQKLTMYKHLQRSEQTNKRFKDAISNLVSKIQLHQPEEKANALLSPQELGYLEKIVQEQDVFNAEGDLLELPPCSIETTIYKPFQFDQKTMNRVYSAQSNLGGTQNMMAQQMLSQLMGGAGNGQVRGQQFINLQDSNSQRLQTQMML
mmetsp:Transcript_18048/g.30773  ORF Transcript_18048/g.30773 Transcript_18048/m.30773 type:complete len:292 (+) Transcript_18048:544-1419(+)